VRRGLLALGEPGRGGAADAGVRHVLVRRTVVEPVETTSGSAPTLGHLLLDVAAQDPLPGAGAVDLLDRDAGVLGELAGERAREDTVAVRALGGRRVLKESTVRLMTRPRRLPDGTGCRSYGFDVDTGYSSCRGDRFERGTTFGHTGFTGTMFWVDPKNNCYLILLTNSVHPDGKGKTVALRRQVSTAVAEALLGRLEESSATSATRPTTRQAGSTAPAVASIQCGIDVLEADHFKLLDGKRAAVVTNQTGLDAHGTHLVELLAGGKNLKLVKIFSPEHGLYGVLDEKVADATDPKTGLKVYSLYGDVRKPTP